MRTFAGASSSPCWESNASVQAAAGGRAHSLLLAAGPIARAVPSKRRTASRARLQPTVGIARSAHQRWPSRVISIVAKRSPGSAASCIPVPTQTCGQRRVQAQRMPRCRHAQRRCPGCRCWGIAAVPGRAGQPGAPAVLPTQTGCWAALEWLGYSAPPEPFAHRLLSWWPGGEPASARRSAAIEDGSWALSRRALSESAGW
jgi:hypothetical protein